MNITDYLHYTKSSASPESYHVWVYLSMVSSILGKKAWIKCNYFNVYPNLYIILASLPGVGKKSTAMRIGRNAVKDCGLAKEKRPKWSNDSMTPQALMEEMKQAYKVFHTPNKKMYGSSPLTVISSELVSLLFSGVAMVDFLTDIYDADSRFEYKTKNAGSTIIENPCLNILTGVTTDNLGSRIIRDASSGGFMSRSIIVYDNNVRPSSAFDLPDESQEAALSRVKARFSQIGDIYGEFGFSKEALEIYQAFELKEDKAMKTTTANAEFRSRKPIHVLKAALLLAASELTTTIDQVHIEAAIHFLAQVEHNMTFVKMATGGHKNAEIHTRIILALGHAPRVPLEAVIETFMGSTDTKTIEDAISMILKVKWVKMTTDTSEKPAKQYLSLTDSGKKMFAKYS